MRGLFSNCMSSWLILLMVYRLPLCSNESHFKNRWYLWWGSLCLKRRFLYWNRVLVYFQGLYPSTVGFRYIPVYAICRLRSRVSLNHVNIITLKRGGHIVASFVVTSCHCNLLPCSQWRYSRHLDDLSVSMNIDIMSPSASTLSTMLVQGWF